MKGWNGDGTNITPQLFLNDQIHPNKKGFELLDSCIANAITVDVMSRSRE
jgi:hypothetical protein